MIQKIYIYNAYIVSLWRSKSFEFCMYLCFSYTYNNRVGNGMIKLTLLIKRFNMKGHCNGCWMIFYCSALVVEWCDTTAPLVYKKIEINKYFGQIIDKYFHGVFLEDGECIVYSFYEKLPKTPF